jgi:hypothetical protein
MLGVAAGLDPLDDPIKKLRDVIHYVSLFNLHPKISNAEI